MRRPVASIWEVSLSNLWPALTVCGICFFLGGLAGCILASYISGSGSECLIDYLQDFLSEAREETLPAPALFPLICEVARWPLLTILLGFTALGVLALPLLFIVRGFLLSFSIASFVRVFGTAGSLLSFLIFGVSGSLALPVLFVLGVQSLTASSHLAGRAFGERKETCYGKSYWFHCGLCACALFLCVLLEYFVVPVLVTDLAGVLSL